MRIGLLTLEIGRKVGGLEVYETNLIQALARVDSGNEYHVFCLDARVREILGPLADNFHYHVLPVNRYRGVLWDAPRAMARAKLDLFHALFVPPPFTSVPYVLTHHGSEVLERPDFYPFALGLRMRVLFRRGFEKARLIIGVSAFVYDYLTSVRGLPRERVRMIPDGCAPGFHPMDKLAARREVASAYGLDQPYIITVGRIEPRKNPIRVLQAFDQFRRSVANAPRLVFAGKKTWSAKDFDRTIQKLGLKDFIVELGYVPDEHLPSLYAAAEFAVFASLWEGFGYPALEAFATGTPLLSARTTSLPEVCGNAALLVDPYSIEAIASAMASLHNDRRLREELIHKGHARAASFTWDRTARETVSAYKTAADQGKAL
jgi:glycosyltransferase involved in cell wall biosynthesis